MAVVLLGGLSSKAQSVDSNAPMDRPLPKLRESRVVSSLDGHSQPFLFHAPDSAKTRPTAMLVYLHSWSADYRQRNDAWQREAQQRGWIYLHPNFRGPNKTPKACGSKYARQDVLDAMEDVGRRYRIDPQRVYLAGSSGGGHMTMLMVGHHPDRFSAASAWVGISDLSKWYQFHLKDGVPQRYAKMILDSLGGPPGQSQALDSDYRDRSPLFHLQHARDVPLDIAAGVNDGHSGSVPISHSLHAFNILAKANGDEMVSEDELRQLSNDRRLRTPRASDKVTDASLGREIRLRRESGRARVTIFEGGHEGLAGPACHWLSQQARAVKIDK